jgi:two-component system, cell cycle sensor histidine kinase and response regulator CckA
MDKSNPPHSTDPVASPWILLVDDEPAIIPLIGTVLRKHGWKVKEAGGSEAAMMAIEEATTPPSLLICDVLMPGVDGLELTRRILARLPRLKVIFISGHLTDVSWWPADLRGHRFVAKPFTVDQLASVVTEVLGEPEKY